MTTVTFFDGDCNNLHKPHTIRWHVPLVHPHTIVICVHVVLTYTKNSHLLSLTHSRMGMVRYVYGEKGIHETLCITYSHNIVAES